MTTIDDKPVADRVNDARRLIATGKFGEAIALLDKVVARDPANVNAQHYRAVGLHLSGRIEEALAAFEAAVALDSTQSAIFQNQSLALLAASRLIDAIAAARRALALDPANAGASANLVLALLRAGDRTAARVAVDFGLKMAPHHPGLLAQKGHLVLEDGDLPLAEQILEPLAASPSPAPDALYNLAVLRQRQNRDAEALAIYDRVLAVQPGHEGAHVNKAVILRNLGKAKEASALLADFLSKAPASRAALYNKAMIDLYLGDWSQAWNGYEERHAFIGRNPDWPVSDAPIWTGEPRPDATLLVIHEQGFGDTFQFLRLLPALLGRVDKIVFRPQKALFGLLRQMPLFSGRMSLADPEKPLPAHDLRIGLLSLPARFGLQPDTIPEGRLRLEPAPERLARMATFVGKADDAPILRVGLAWRGNPLASVDRGRSLDAAQLKPLFGLPGTRFFALHHDMTGNERSILDGHAVVPPSDFDADGAAFCDTAALIACLDLVITTDTAIAHLAGLMGKPCWLMLKKVPDWRWGPDGLLTSWYPTIRLFRQPADGDWQSVIANIGEAMRELADLSAKKSGPDVFAQATTLHQAGRLQDVARLYAQCTGPGPRQAHALNLLAMTRFVLAGRSGEAAIEALTPTLHSVALAPDIADHWSNLAILVDKLPGSGDWDRAIARALATDPHHGPSLLAKGRRALREGRVDEARSFAEGILTRQPGQSAAAVLKAQCESRLGSLDAAIRTLSDASRRDPNNAALHLERGLILSSAGQMLDARMAWEAALVIEPDNADALSNLGVAERQANHLGLALTWLARATDVDPNHAEAWCNRGISLVEAGRHEQAATCFRRALACRPDYPEAELALGMAELMLGDRTNGLAHYEARLRSPTLGIAENRPDLPFWHGEPLNGRSILVLAEQGFGDAFQFVRHCAELKALGAGRVVVGCRRAIAHLLASAPGIDAVVSQGEPLPKLDVMVYMMSLPGLVEKTGSQLSTVQPYLSADPGSSHSWREWFASIPGFRIGIAWQGNPDPKVDKGRSFPLAALAPLAALPGISLISLQRGAGSEQIEALEGRFTVHRPPPGFDEGPDAFADTAGLMSGLDLVISSDTAIAHLAGALGRPTIILLKAFPEWRWGASGPMTALYPETILVRSHKGELDTTPFQGAMRRLVRVVDRLKAGDGAGALAEADAPPKNVEQTDPTIILKHVRLLIDQPNLAAASDLADRALLHGGGVAAIKLLGVSELIAGQHHRAVIMLREAMRLDPADDAVRTNLSIALRHSGLRRQARQMLDEIIARRPTTEALLARANLLRDDDDFAGAISDAKTAIAADPGMAKAWRALGNGLRDLNRIDEAVAALEQARTLTPDDPELLLDLAHARLANGDLEQGFALYEHRWSTSEVKPRDLGKPRWTGDAFPGTLLIHGEQGFGDNIQFVRFARLAAQRAGRVTIAVRQPLERLFSATDFGSDTIRVTGTDDPGGFDAEIPMMSLPFALDTDWDSLPPPPLFRPETKDMAEWRDWLGATGKTIGLVWQGNPLARADKGRSPPLNAFAELFRRDDLTIVPLQREHGLDQVKAVPGAERMRLPADRLGDFQKTAALIANLDLVISSCTATLHLAASLGVPTFGLLKANPDWRWMTGRMDSPWYPALTLFRQDRLGDWQTPVNAMMHHVDRI